MFFLRMTAKIISRNIPVIVLVTATTLSIMAATAQASVTVYQPGEMDVKDVWVQPTHAGVGNNETLHVWKSSSIGGFKSLYEVSTLFPMLTSSVQISSAMLNLFVIDTEGGSHSSHAPGYQGLTVPIKVSAMANPWTEESLIGGTPEAIQFWDNSVAASGNAITQKSITGADVGNWVSFDVTEQLQSWQDYSLSGGADGLPYYGFLIEATDEIRASDGGVLLTAYHSSAASDSTLHPYLEVTTVPVPTAVWLFGSALLGLLQINRRIK